MGSPIIPVFVGKLSAEAYLSSAGFSYCSDLLAKSAGLEVIPGEYTGAAFGSSIHFIGKAYAQVFIREKKIEEIFFIGKDIEIPMSVVLGAAALKSFGIIIDYGNQLITVDDLSVPFTHKDHRLVNIHSVSQES